MGQRYYADPQRIEALAEQLEEIGDLARSMTEEFLDELAPTVSWPGSGDDFADTAKPQEKKERQTTKDTMFAIRDAVVGITDATLEQVRLMEHTRDGNLEGIKQVNDRVETNGSTGDGADTGGHGRH
ncbi:hypothetical protein ACIREE_14695 [Streptomyces sp. NPDC102467]|uniref:hypothetical protein n=1 Tax=Streptomyces sp. NPDC102467 TaxID=3366179 RepID=UPI0037F9F80F